MLIELEMNQTNNKTKLPMKNFKKYIYIETGASFDWFIVSCATHKKTGINVLKKHLNMIST